ncbi:MAG TPA: hypothetical protein PKW55_07140 [Spirochaetota bacterium]|nr:hypothetical protein [Spirochaetota bacterium]HOM38709.1 hypothetical protein [Spirochaetota bacterium]HPQ49506.1 hypothetical protein [Spirochaetota bacterium]
MPKRKKVYTLRITLSSIFTIVILLTSLAIGVVTFVNLKNNIRASIKDRLHDIAGISALSIDPEKQNFLRLKKMRREKSILK